ncbi:4-galactosyl-N-acetylglucosaminide 3-alpha-L-fucosyltransferase 9-like [Pygocentrus nattereri]|uniref:4-galactosyl-N-acetylglucosaminide 3-alpha-L-fucosyltransferase 9-like n=1 Tax=Pygocentrus nattereri TaxID=42514 RepID=UPI00081474FD|nr:4-galactosyl-N-acetylglucosaminide 3-alpha-L-fucosyltransferase 9-like [Pygocentrus nattereri]
MLTCRSVPFTGSKPGLEVQEGHQALDSRKDTGKTPKALLQILIRKMTRAPLRPLQHLPAALVVLLFFGGLLLVYFTPRLSWTAHSAAPTDDVQSKNPRQSANTSYSASNTWTNGSTGRTQAVTSAYVDSANRKDELATVVLIWTWPFGRQFDLRSCSSLYNITGCRLTSDRSQYPKAHGVMFHHREICHNLPSLLTIPRSPLQKWVWMNMESPANSPRLPGPASLFNLTANYRRDSDVWVPYGRVVEASNDDKAFKIPNKDKLVCWIVNNWNDSFWRVKYFNQLSNHIKVDTFGGHFGRYLSYRDYFKTMSSCKFYLSFENSIHKDYITEKLFNPMISGTVPVVLGPPRANYEEFIPADSFIHVNDFKTPQELAEHLTYLDQNQEMYEQYFTWRKHFVARRSDFGVEHACRICDHIKQHKGYRVFKHLNTWYWG